MTAYGVGMVPTYPEIVQTVLDTANPRLLAEFYREFLGLRYRAGDEPPESADDRRGREWLVLTGADGAPALAFQGTAGVRPSTWPSGEVPMQLHLDLAVDSAEELDRQRDRALELGASQLLDRRDDAEEPLVVFADPAGHPFCVFVR